MIDIFLSCFIVVPSLLSIFLISSMVNAQVKESQILKNTIKKGTSDINLLLAQGNKAISPAIVELFQLENNGLLILVVDINEASSGGEKAASQGVAIEHLTLTVVTNENTFVSTDFSTKTKSSLAKIDSEVGRFTTLY
jgi:hypothetical protein